MSIQTSPKPKHSAPKRAAAITIAGWILLVGALVNLVSGVLYLYGSELLTSNANTVEIFSEGDAAQVDPLTQQGEFAAQGVIDLFLGVVQLVITFGFWGQQRWAWVAAMSWQALKLLFEIASVLNGGGTMLTILFASLLVLLLNQNEVRRAFQIQPPEDESSSPSIRSLDVN